MDSKPIPEFHIGYVASSMNSGVHNLEESINRARYPHSERLGLGVKWEGWVTRVRLYHDFCAQFPPSDIVILMDAYDVLVVREYNPEELLAAFESYERPIICAAEDVCGGNCAPLVPQIWEHPRITQRPKKNRYANAGFVMGRAGAMTRLYQDMLSRPIQDDQLALCQHMNREPQAVALDAQSCVVFNDNFGQNGKYGFRDRWVQQVRDADSHVAKPFFVHFPGCFYKSQLFKWSDWGKSNYETVGKLLLDSEYSDASFANPNARNHVYATFALTVAILSTLTVLFCVLFIRERWFNKRRPAIVSQPKSLA